MRAGAKKLSALLNGTYSPDEEESPEAQAKIATGGMTLHEAVRKQDEEAVRTLAGMGEDLNAISEEHGFAGLSPLAVACQTCDVKMAALLLGLGADPSVKNSEGEPAIAALFSQQIMIHAPKKLYEDRLAEQLVDLLVRYGFDPNDSVNDQGDCLLGLACSSLYGRGDGRNSVIDMVVEEAIRQGADVDRKNNMGQTPLMLACAGDFRTMEEVETALLEAGADASIADNQSRTALHMASQAGNKDIIRLLCDNGVDVNGSDQQGKTPLILAAREGQNDMVAFLIENGADVNLVSNSQRSALYYATENGFTEIVEQLLMAGAEG